jgi:hypothetical protein
VSSLALILAREAEGSRIRTPWWRRMAAPCVSDLRSGEDPQEADQDQQHLDAHDLSSRLCFLRRHTKLEGPGNCCNATSKSVKSICNGHIEIHPDRVSAVNGRDPPTNHPAPDAHDLSSRLCVPRWHTKLEGRGNRCNATSKSAMSIYNGHIEIQPDRVPGLVGATTARPIMPRESCSWWAQPLLAASGREMRVCSSYPRAPVGLSRNPQGIRFPRRQVMVRY